MPTEKIKAFLETACREHVFSGYQLYIEKDGEASEWVGGVTSYWSEDEAIGASTYFDIGSLTKVIVAASIAARCTDAGMQTNERLGDIVEKFRDTPYAPLRLGDLLAHSAGVLWWAPVSLPLEEWFVSHVEKILVDAPGKKATYSDLSILLATVALEKRVGPIQKAFETEIATPLKLNETCYGPLNTKDVAATEVDLSTEAPLKGVVFDKNCRVLGSSTGHAGLFSTARGLAPFCREWLDARAGKSDWVTEETAKLFTSPSRRAPHSTWAYGWDTRSPEYSSTGKHWSPSSFGHLGFPGTSMWMDPGANGFAIFLTNRIHPSWVDERIKKIRPLLHDEIAMYWRR